MHIFYGPRCRVDFKIEQLNTNYTEVIADYYIDESERTTSEDDDVWVTGQDLDTVTSLTTSRWFLDDLQLNQSWLPAVTGARWTMTSLTHVDHTDT